MTANLERAHAKFLSQGKSFAVVGFRCLGVRGLTLHRDLTESETSGCG